MVLRTAIKILIYIFVILKTKWLLAAIFGREASPPDLTSYAVSYDDYLASSNSNASFQIMDRKGVSFLVEPDSCSVQYPVMVLSAPKNLGQRQRIRNELKSEAGNDTF